MQDLIASEITGTFRAVPFEVATLRIVAAIVLGGLIGAEREWRHKPAGLRTHILVSLAASLFFIIGREISLVDFGAVGEMRIDPLRLIEATTAGVAFLVAGIIITSGGKVKNITTGASLWLAGAIGLACGSGNVPLATLATVLVLLVLSLLSVLEPRPPEEE